MNSELGAGLAPYMQWVVEIPGKVVPRIDAMPIHSSPNLYKKWPIAERCFVVGGENLVPPSSAQRDPDRYLPRQPIPGDDPRRPMNRPSTDRGGDMFVPEIKHPQTNEDGRNDNLRPTVPELSRQRQSQIEQSQELLDSSLSEQPLPQLPRRLPNSQLPQRPQNPQVPQRLETQQQPRLQNPESPPQYQDQAPKRIIKVPSNSQRHTNPLW